MWTYSRERTKGKTQTRHQAEPIVPRGDFCLGGLTNTQNEGILRFGMEILSDVVVYLKRKVYRLVFK